jgi:hypothetical protein
MLVVPTELEYLSAKDAKDAKDAKIYCYILLIAASDNHCGKFSDHAGQNPLKLGSQNLQAVMA